MNIALGLTLNPHATWSIITDDVSLMQKTIFEKMGAPNITSPNQGYPAAEQRGMTGLDRNGLPQAAGNQTQQESEDNERAANYVVKIKRKADNVGYDNESASGYVGYDNESESGYVGYDNWTSPDLVDTPLSLSKTGVGVFCAKQATTIYT
jgi:hypothetical protein